MRLAAGLRCSAPPDSLAVIRGGEGGKGKQRVGNREGGEDGREGREEVGRDGKGREEWKGEIG